MKLLGIDYGSKHIGIAATNDDGTIAFPREPLENSDKLLALIRDYIEKEKIEEIIVGDTRSFSGGENTVTKEAEAFIAALEQSVSIPVRRAFEVSTSQEAARFAPRGERHNDSAAAAVILQRYIDMHGTPGVE